MEEKTRISKGLIFVAILLFPLIPFALIYKSKFNRKLKAGLVVIWFIALCAIYQYACISEGPVVKSISTPSSTITLSVGEKTQLEYTINPDDKNLVIENTTFTSSDRSVATIDEKGNIETILPGKTTLKITVIDNHHQTREKKVKLIVIK